MQTTWVTDLVCLPDVNVICTASAERDLRFYDTTAQKFELRVQLTSLPDAVCALDYNFGGEVSRLLLGDMAGGVRMLEFAPKDRGPFKSKPGQPLTSVMWEQAVHGAVPDVHLRDLRPFHSDWVRQLGFYEKMACVVSASPCSKSSMILHSLTEREGGYIFKVQKVRLGLRGLERLI